MPNPIPTCTPAAPAHKLRSEYYLAAPARSHNSVQIFKYTFWHFHHDFPMNNSGPEMQRVAGIERAHARGPLSGALQAFAGQSTRGPPLWVPFPTPPSQPGKKNVRSLRVCGSFGSEGIVGQAKRDSEILCSFNNYIYRHESSWRALLECRGAL